MHSRIALLVACVVVGLSAASGVARAQNGPDPGPSDLIEKCLQDQPVDPFNPPSCTFDGDGNLISRGGNESGAGAGSGSGVGVFIFFALFWAAIPLGIAIGVASHRSQSAGLAVLLTLALGWIGLLIFVYLMRRDVEPLARETLSRAASPPHVPNRRSVQADVAERIRTLEDLKAQGLITDQEYANRRSSILSDI